MSAQEQDGPRVGSLAEEAARLLDALQQTAAGWRATGEPGGGHQHRHPQDDGPVPAACRVCPVCQLLARVQQVRPEVVQHLAEAASSLVAALGELATDHSRPAERPQPRPDVQHIDISD